MSTPPLTSMPTLTAPRRWLASPVLDMLLGPHGVDRYLELVHPALTVRDPRATVLAVRHQTPRSATLTLRPNAAFAPGRAGQFVKVGVEIDGVRHTRTYSPAVSEHAGGLELTITEHPDGLVSRHLVHATRPGDVLHLSAVQGEFALPTPRPRRLVLISGGSGITPVMAMLRTLCDEPHDGDILFVHYARTAADWLYREETEALARRHRGLSLHYVATREGGEHLSAARLRALAGGLLDGTEAADGAVCGPPALLDAAQAIWSELPGELFRETFTAPRLAVAAEPGTGTLHFTRSDTTAPVSAGSLLEQAEAAGLSPAYGCRMGICHTCTCRKRAGAVRNVLTGRLSDGEDEDIQLCISVPAGDVALDL